MNIVIRYPFAEQQIQSFQRLATEWGGHEVTQITDQTITDSPADTEVIMGHIDPAVFLGAPGLRWIQADSAGLDQLLFPELTDRPVVVLTNMAGLYAVQGAEQAWALLLALCRGIDLSVAAKLKREWKGGRGIVLTGSTLGVVGAGGFGQEIAKRARGYDMHVIGIDPVLSDPPPGFDELARATTENLHGLLSRSDAVMIACPLTQETYHLIGTEELQRMKGSAYLVNVTRGGIVDEDALIRALMAEEIAGAGLDVAEGEPLDRENPLFDAPNLMLTGHHAGTSQYRQQVIFDFFHANLERYLRGEPLVNITDPKRGF